MNSINNDKKIENSSNDPRAQETVASKPKAIMEGGTNVKNKTSAPDSFSLGEMQYRQAKVARTSPLPTSENGNTAITSTANYSSGDLDFSEPLKDPSNSKKTSSSEHTNTAAESSFSLKEEDVQSTKSFASSTNSSMYFLPTSPLPTPMSVGEDLVDDTAHNHSLGSAGVGENLGMAGNANQSTEAIIQKIMKEKEMRSLSGIGGAKGVGSDSDTDAVAASKNDETREKDGMGSGCKQRQRNQQQQQLLQEKQQLKESTAANKSSNTPNESELPLQQNRHFPTEGSGIYSTVEDILMHSTHSSSNSLVESESDGVAAADTTAATSCAAIAMNTATTPSPAGTTQSPSKLGTASNSDTEREFPLPESKRPRNESETKNCSRPMLTSSSSLPGNSSGDSRVMTTVNKSDNSITKEDQSSSKTDEGFKDEADFTDKPSIKVKPKLEEHSAVNVLASDGEDAAGVMPVTTSAAGVKEETTVTAANTAATIKEDEKKEEESSAVTTDLTSYSMRQHFGLKLPEQRWRAHQIAEDYISLASAITLPPTHLGPFGYSSSTGQYPIEQVTSLGYLTSPIRRPTVIEKWSPYEIVTFEAALALHGKVFHKVQKWVKTKNTKEIVEFYYIWKKTSHYQKWKSQYESEIEDDDSSDDERKGGYMPISTRGRR